MFRTRERFTEQDHQMTMYQIAKRNVYRRIADARIGTYTDELIEYMINQELLDMVKKQSENNTGFDPDRRIRCV